MTAIADSLLAVMRAAMSSTFTALHSTQAGLDTEYAMDTVTFQTRGRFPPAEVEALLRSASEVAHPFGRAGKAAAAATVEEAGDNHGWPSYRALALAPTEGDVAIAVQWRFTVPHRESVVDEIEHLWTHPVDSPLAPREPRPEVEPITVGWTGLRVGSTSILPMQDGRFDARLAEDMLKPRVFTEGGVELLSADELDLLVRVMRALVDHDRHVLDTIGAFDGGADPYMWTHDYGRHGTVHFVLPPGDIDEWQVDVMQVDTSPGVSFVTVDMWTRELGRSELSLELELETDQADGTVRGRFGNLHVL